MSRMRKNENSEGSTKDGKQTCQRSGLFRVYGALVLAVVTSLCAALCSVVVRSMVTISAPEIVLTRGLGVTVINLPFLIHYTRTEGTFKASDLPNLTARGLGGAALVCLNYISWKLMPIAEASIIASTSPVWVILLSRLILKENLGLLNVLSVLFSVFGLILMSRVFSLVFGSASEKYSNPDYWYGCLAAVLSSILNAFTAIFLRKMKDVTGFVIMIFQSVLMLIISGIIVGVQWKFTLPRCGLDGFALVSLVVISFVGEMSYVKAFKYDKAAAVASVRVSGQVVFQFIFQVLIFNEIPDVYSILATVFVFISLWLSAARKYFKEKRHSREPDTGNELIMQHVTKA